MTSGVNSTGDAHSDERAASHTWPGWLAARCRHGWIQVGSECGSQPREMEQGLPDGCSSRGFNMIIIMMTNPSWAVFTSGTAGVKLL